MTASQNTVSNALSGNTVNAAVDPVDVDPLVVALENTVSNVASGNTANLDTPSVVRRGPLGLLAGLTVFLYHSQNPRGIADLWFEDHFVKCWFWQHAQPGRTQRCAPWASGCLGRFNGISLSLLEFS